MWQDTFKSFADGDFFLAVFQLIMSLLITVVNVILFPFSKLVESTMPNLDAGLQQLAEYFSYSATYMSWVMDAFAIPTLAVSMIATYYLFVFTITLAVWGVKLVVKWKNAIL